MTSLGVLKVLLLSLSFSLWLRTTSAGLQCPTTFLPSDVLPSVKYNYSAAPFADFFAQLYKTVPATVAQSQYKAYSIALLHRDQTVYSSGLVNTPFRLGSITKSFTCLGALLLRERGVLSLDDPVKKFLPNFSVINPYGKHNITLRELMGHVSGLPRDFGCVSLPCITSEEEALKLIARMQLVRPPWNNIPVYSNIGVALLGHAWEKATSPQKSWSDFLRDEFFVPLGMNSTGTDLAHVKLAAGDLSPYPANESIGWIGPAGEM